MPAMLADLFGRPQGPTARIFRQSFPRALNSVGGWLASEVRAGRIRPLPVLLLIQQLIGPLAVHLLFRPAMSQEPGWGLPSVEQTCAVFADSFLRAITVPTATAGASYATYEPLSTRESES
jgi:hypothetical protein